MTLRENEGIREGHGRPLCEGRLSGDYLVVEYKVGDTISRRGFAETTVHVR